MSQATTQVLTATVLTVGDIDSFPHLPVNFETYQGLHNRLKICLVSPKPQQHSREMIRSFREQLRSILFVATSELSGYNV